MSFTLNVQETKSSLEIGQTAKGDWYVKSTKVYFQEQSAEAGRVVSRVAAYKRQLGEVLAARNVTPREPASPVEKGGYV